VIIYGHRGAKEEAPENTTEGVEFAFKQGINRFELDVRLTQDGKLVVIHDSSLLRTVGQEKNIYDVDSKQLPQLDARSGGVSWPVPCHIPILDDLLKSLPEVKHWQLEVKTDDKKRLNILCNRLIELIHHEKLLDQVVITSSDKWFLKEVRRRDKKIKTGFVAEKQFSDPIKITHQYGCQFLCLSWKLCTEALVKKAHAASLTVSCWTVNSIHDAVKLKKMGVDSIITDYPTSTSIYFKKSNKTD